MKFSKQTDAHGAYIFSLEIPGLNQENIKVAIKDQTLYISSKTNRKKKKNKSCFQHATFIPYKINQAAVTTIYQGNSVTIRIPKE